MINNNSKGTVFIIDNNKLCGVLTDGDIRRLLLSGYKLQEKIANVIGGEFVYAYNTETYEQVLSKLKNSIKIIPLVNKDFEVVDYVYYDKDVHVPVADLDLRGNEFKYLIDAFLTTWISSQGPYVEMFEKNFAKFCGCEHAVTTSSGTVALHLALLALGIGKGDEVIVPDLTFVATINAVLYTGATPVIVDVEEESWCIDPKEIEKAITGKTKAVIPVHLYGQPCDMSAIMAIAKKHKIFVVEDCAEAHGATFDGKYVGSFGQIGCFSFYGNKVITTGEGGMCVTDDPVLHKKMVLLKNHGMSQERKYWHDVVGYNYRMTNLQAAIGVAQLEKISEFLRNRAEVEEKYKKLLLDIPFVEFQRDDLPKRKKITWLVSILVNENRRDSIISKLKDKGMDTRPFFYPLSVMDIYKQYAARPCQKSKDIAARGMNLPTVYNKKFEETVNMIRESF